MTEDRFTSVRLIDRKPRKVIVDEIGNIINRVPTKEELSDLEKESYSPKKRGRYQKCTGEELLGFMRKFYEENKRPPAWRDFVDDSKYPNSQRYIACFGSWNKAIEVAGLSDKVNFSHYTDEELLEYLKQFYEENDRVPITEDFDCNLKYPSYNTYRSRFGSWNNAIEKAGLHIKRFTKTTDNELLEYLKEFEKDNGRPPKQLDFNDNPKYPNYRTYMSRFGSWQKTLRLVDFDIDTMIRKGVVETNIQKGRQSELYILETNEKESIDLSGQNCQSFVDGISKNDISKNDIYDVKSSSLHKGKYWTFILDKCVDFYYLVAYDKDHNNVLYKWKIPGDFAEGSIVIGNNNYYTYNLQNMKEYEITE